MQRIAEPRAFVALVGRMDALHVRNSKQVRRHMCLTVRGCRNAVPECPEPPGSDSVPAPPKIEDVDITLDGMRRRRHVSGPSPILPLLVDGDPEEGAIAMAELFKSMVRRDTEGAAHWESCSREWMDSHAPSRTTASSRACSLRMMQTPSGCCQRSS